MEVSLCIQYIPTDAFSSIDELFSFEATHLQTLHAYLHVVRFQVSAPFKPDPLNASLLCKRTLCLERGTLSAFGLGRPEKGQKNALVTSTQAEQGG